MCNYYIFPGYISPPPALQNLDDDEVLPCWDSNYERDYEDFQYSPSSPMAHFPAAGDPLVCFLSDEPDWKNLDKAALENAL